MKMPYSKERKNKQLKEMTRRREGKRHQVEAAEEAMRIQQQPQAARTDCKGWTETNSLPSLRMGKQMSVSLLRPLACWHLGGISSFTASPK